jgi:hypothetical protein
MLFVNPTVPHVGQRCVCFCRGVCMFFRVLAITALIASIGTAENQVIDGSNRPREWAVELRQDTEAHAAIQSGFRLKRRLQFGNRSILILEEAGHFTLKRHIDGSEYPVWIGKRSLQESRSVLTAAVDWFELQEPRERRRKALFDDPLYAEQWFLASTTQTRMS